MASFENDVVVAKNLNFDQAAAKPHLGVINAAGKLPIGTGNSYPTPEILGGSLTSPDGSITIGYSSPNITLQGYSAANDLYTAKWIVNATPGQGGNQTTIQAAINAAVSGETIAIFPGNYTENLTLKAGVNLTAWGCDAIGNATGHVIINGNATFTGAGTVTLFGIQLQTNGAACLTVSGSSASVVNLINCYINCTNATGVVFSSSSASAGINIFNCIANINTTGIAFFSHSSAGQILIERSSVANAGASTTANTQSAGFLIIRYSVFENPITTSATGLISLQYCFISTAALNVTCLTNGGAGSSTSFKTIYSSGTASAVSISTILDMVNDVVNSTNTNAITGSGQLVYSSIHFTNTSSNVNVTTQTIRAVGPSTTIGSANSGNTNTLTVTNTSNTASSGAVGRITVGGATAADPVLSFIVTGAQEWVQGIDNSDSDAYVISQGNALGTNNVMRISTAGEINEPLQPCFSARASSQLNVTGAGTAYTVLFANEIFDQNNDFASPNFTAPVTGRYLFTISVVLVDLGAANTTGSLSLVTSNRSYLLQSLNIGAVRNASNAYILTGSAIADMDAADTASVQVVVLGGAGDTVDVFGDATSTWFQGVLLA